MSKRLMKMKRSESSIENILASYLEERDVELTEKEQKTAGIYKAAFTMLIEDDSIVDTVKKLEKLYNISTATAYRMIANAETVFGNVKKFNKEAWRFIQIERKRRYIKECVKDRNYELVEKFEKQIDNLLGFDKDDLAFDINKIKAQDYEIVIARTQQILIDQILAQKNGVNMNVDDAIDIDFTEIKEIQLEESKNEETN